MTWMATDAVLGCRRHPLDGLLRINVSPVCFGKGPPEDFYTSGCLNVITHRRPVATQVLGYPFFPHFRRFIEAPYSGRSGGVRTRNVGWLSRGGVSSQGSDSKEGGVLSGRRRFLTIFTILLLLIFLGTGCAHYPFKLDPVEVDRLRVVARKLLEESPEYQRLLRDLH